MKLTRSHLLFLAAATSAHAADQTWIDANANNDWSTTAAPNWDIAAPTEWVNANNAIFGGVGETVSTTAAITVTNMAFGSGGYTIANGTGGSIALAGNSIVDVTNASDTATISAALDYATFTLNKTGTGTLVFNAAATNQGTTSVSAGTLRFGTASNVALGSGLYDIASGATLLLDRSTAAGQTWGNFRGAGTLTLNSAQAINASANWGNSGTNTFHADFTGTLKMQKGRLEVTNPATQLGGMTTIEVVDGGQISFYQGGTISQNFKLAGTGWGEGPYASSMRLGNTAATTLNGTITLTGDATIGANNNSANTAVSTFAGVIGESGGVRALTFGYTNGTNAIYQLTAANTYSGATTLMKGTLDIAGAGSLGSGNYAGDIANAGTLKFSTSANQTLSGAISGAGTLTKSGVGTLTLSSASNSIGGATFVNAGTLALTGSAALPSPTITVASGALFDVSGLTGGAFTVAATKTLVAGRATTPATDVSGDLIVDSGTLIVAGSGTGGTTTIDGNLTLNGAQLQVDYSGVAADKVSLTGASRSLSLTGTTVVTGILPAGSYTLIDGYTSLSGSETNLSYSTSARNSTGVFTVGASSVTLDVTATPGNLTWNGAVGSTVWDVNNTANWNAGAEKFYQLDAVTFADSPANSTVTINGTVMPGSISFTNASTAYTVRGGTNPVIVGPGALSKSGAAQVTLWHPANTYSGGTTIDAGTLLLRNDTRPATGNYSPLGTGLVTLNGGTLQINPGGGGGNTYTFPNAIRLNGGTLFHEDGKSVINGLVTVDAASTIRTQYDSKDLTLAGGLAGSGNLTVSNGSGGYGSAIVAIGANGTYSGSLTINNSAGYNGIVQLNTGNALKDATVVLNTTAALDPYNSKGVGLVLGGAADTNFTIAGLSGAQAAAAIHNANDANTRTLTVNQSADTTFSGSIGGTSANTQRLNLVKSGAGSLTLAGANTYTGNTTVSAGTLVMPTRNIGIDADVTVADDATLALSSTGVPLFIDALNLGTSGSNTLAITNFTANSGIKVIDAGVVTKNGTTTISVSGTLVSGGTFPQISPLIGYESTAGTGTLDLAPLPRGVAGVLEDDVEAKVINLKITGFDSLVWKGTAGNTWDLDTTSNWKLGALDPATYLNGDNVLFDGSAASTTVDLTGNLAPTSVTFDFDDPVAYTLGGTGAITGATGLTKQGTGTLTLGTANSYDGTTTVNAGTLVLGNASALGSTLGGTTVADGATVDLNGYSTGGETYALDGSLLNNGAVASTVGGAITLSGDAVIGGSGDIALSAPASGTASLVKSGSGTLTFGSTLNSSITGTLTVSEGMVVIAGSNYNSALGNAAGIIVENAAILRLNATNKLYGGGSPAGVPVTVNAGGKVEINSEHNHFKILNLNGGEVSGIGTVLYNNEYSTFDSTVTVAGAAMSTISRAGTGVYLLSGATFEVGEAATGTDLLVSAPFSGDVLIKNGEGTMELAAANTYTGNTTVNAGSLHVSTNGRIRFVLGATSGTSNTLSGAGSTTLDGGFAINTAAADALASGTWVLESVATSTYNSGFKVYEADGTTAWTDAGGDKWTKTGAGGRIWTFDESNGTLTLAIGGGYDSWAQQIANPDDRDRTDDPDGDGFTNEQEFLFGKNPTVSNGSLVNSTVAGGNLTLTWLQRESGATYSLMESGTLATGSWAASAVTPQSDLQPGDPADYDQWMAVIPLGAGKKFFRIEGLEN